MIKTFLKILVLVFNFGLSILFIYIGASSITIDTECIFGGLFLFALTLWAVIQAHNQKEQENNHNRYNTHVNQYKEHSDLAGTIHIEDIEPEPKEDNDYEYIEVKSYVRRKKK